MKHLSSFFKDPLSVLTVSLFFFLFALTLWSPHFLPYNMDEFSGQHPIACREFPLNMQIQHYTVGCHEFELTPPFLHEALPLRSFSYVGSNIVAPYYPLYVLIGDPISIRIQGFIYFVIIVILLAAVTKVRTLYALLASLIFPFFFFNAMADTGITDVPTICLLLCMLSIQNMPKANPRNQRWYGLLLGIAGFMGLWAKLTFAWFFIPLLLFSIWKIRDNGRLATLKELRIPILIAFLSVALPLAYLLLSRDNRGVPFVLINDHQFAPYPSSVLRVFKRIAAIMVDERYFVNRFLVLPHYWYDILPLFTAAAFTLWSLIRTSTRLVTLRFLVCTGIVFATMLFFKATAWPHHAMTAVVFLIVSMAAGMPDMLKNRKSFFFALIAVLAFSWLTIAIRLPKASINGDANFEKDRLIGWIHSSGTDSQTVQIHSTWGTYYIATLFGAKDQAVTFVYDIQDHTDELQSILLDTKILNRDILIVTSEETKVTDSDMVTSLLGQPSSIHREGNWTALRYNTKAAN